MCSGAAATTVASELGVLLLQPGSVHARSVLPPAIQNSVLPEATMAPGDDSPDAMAAGLVQAGSVQSTMSPLPRLVHASPLEVTAIPVGIDWLVARMTTLSDPSYGVPLLDPPEDPVDEPLLDPCPPAQHEYCVPPQLAPDCFSPSGQRAAVKAQVPPLAVHGFIAQQREPVAQVASSSQPPLQASFGGLQTPTPFVHSKPASDESELEFESEPALESELESELVELACALLLLDDPEPLPSVRGRLASVPPSLVFGSESPRICAQPPITTAPDRPSHGSDLRVSIVRITTSLAPASRRPRSRSSALPPTASSSPPPSLRRASARRESSRPRPRAGRRRR